MSDIPKKCFDMEYSTQSRREYQWLQDCGIKPTYVKTDSYGVRTYKYKKTSTLFLNVYGFYAAKEEEPAKNGIVSEETAKKILTAAAGDENACE